MASKAPSLGFPFRLRQLSQIYYRQGEGEGRNNHLDWLPVHRLKRGTQGFVTPYNFIEASFQHSDVQGHHQAPGSKDVVKGQACRPLVQEPQPLLSERQETGFRWSVLNELPQQSALFPGRKIQDTLRGVDHVASPFAKRPLSIESTSSSDRPSRSTDAS